MTHEWIQNLCSVLDRMETLYGRILPLLDKERTSLIELNYERLYTELSEKDEILSAIRRLDRERLRFQDHFATISGKPSSEITLRWLGEYLVSEGGFEAELGVGLLARRERIEAVVEEVSQRVQRNGRFIAKSVQNIRSIAQDISEALGHGSDSNEARNEANHSTYSSKAKVKKPTQKSGAIVSKSL